MSLEPDCDEMAKFANSTELKLSLLVNLIISIVAVPILLKAIYFISTKPVFHINTRLQIIVHLFALLLHSIGRIVLHSKDLYNYTRNWESGCEILPNFYRCLIFRGFYNIGLALSSMCSFALVLERFAATYYSKSYEHCKFYLGLLLVELQLFLAFCFLFSLYFHAAFVPGEFVVYYCQVISISSGSILFFVVPLYVVMFSQIFSRFMFQFLIRKNRKLRAVIDISLSNRYNLEEGIQSMNSLNILLTFCTIIFVLLPIATTTLHLNSEKLSKQNYISLVEIVHILPLHGIALSVGIFTKLKSMRQTKQKKLMTAIQTDNEYYFQQTRLQWR